MYIYMVEEEEVVLKVSGAALSLSLSLHIACIKENPRVLTKRESQSLDIYA
jgi:hypothetical protein